MVIITVYIKDLFLICDKFHIFQATVISAGMKVVGDIRNIYGMAFCLTKVIHLEWIVVCFKGL